MRKTYTVIAEGEKACAKHKPEGEEVLIQTNDIEFRGRVTNRTETTVSVLGFRTVVRRNRAKFIDVRVQTVLHFNLEDVLNLRSGSYTGERLNVG